MARDLLIGFGVGAFSGAFGVGGGIILVPLLVLLLHMQQKRAQATSLVMVSMAALAGAVTYAIADYVAWLPAVFILVGGIAGSLVGSSVVRRTADYRLQIAFGIILIAAAARLLWPTEFSGGADLPGLTLPIALGYALSGLAMGVLSALLGIGGGIILIPVLVAIFGFPQQLAAGTSLAVMAPIAMVGAWRQSRTGATDWRTGSRFGLASIPGSVLGATAAVLVSGDLVRTAFAVLITVVAVQMLIKGWKLRQASWRSEGG